MSGMFEGLPTLLEMVQESLADNRGVSDSLKSTIATTMEWAERDFAMYSEDATPDERTIKLVAKFQARVAEATEAMKLITAHEAMLADKIKNGPDRFKIKTRVRVIADQIDWSGENNIPVGLVGTVASSRQVPAVPKGMTAVRFRSSDFNFVTDEDYPLDHDENTIIYYLWNFTLEPAEEGAMSVVPEPRKWNLNPAPEGKRWAIVYDDTEHNMVRELYGHCCGCHEEMTEYVANGMGRIELRDRHTEGWEMNSQVLV